MAKDPDRKQPMPIYHVCKVDAGGKLTIVKRDVQARTQILAMDQVANSGDFEGEFQLAAFLASSLRSKKYVRHMQPVLDSEEVDVFGDEHVEVIKADQG
jgi:hypothetical protein